MTERQESELYNDKPTKELIEEFRNVKRELENLQYEKKFHKTNTQKEQNKIKELEIRIIQLGKELSNRLDAEKTSLDEKLDILLIFEEARDDEKLRGVLRGESNIDVSAGGSKLDTMIREQVAKLQKEYKPEQLANILELKRTQITQTHEELSGLYRRVTGARIETKLPELLKIPELKKIQEYISATYTALNKEYPDTYTEAFGQTLHELLTALQSGNRVAQQDALDKLFAEKMPQELGKIMSTLCDRQEGALPDPYKKRLLVALIGRGQETALNKIEVYKTTPGQYHINWKPAEIREMQVTLAALHAAANVKQPDIDGLFVETLNAEKLMKLETTWFVYAMELTDVIPNTFGILLSQPEGKTPWEVQKKTVLDFCLLYHNIRSRGRKFEGQIPYDLLQTYFEGLATFHADPDAKVTLTATRKSSETEGGTAPAVIAKTLTIEERNAFHQAKITEYLMGFYEMRLGQLQAVKEKNQKYALGKQQAAEERLQGIQTLRKDVNTRKNDMSKKMEKNGTFRNRLLQYESDASVDALFKKGGKVCKKLYEQSQGFSELNDEVRDSTYKVYETSFQMAGLLKDTDRQEIIVLSTLLDCGASYVKENKLMYGVAMNILNTKKPYAEGSQEYEILDVLLRRPEDLADLFESKGALNTYVLDTNAMFKEKLTISGSIALGGQGYDDELYKRVFGETAPNRHEKHKTNPLGMINVGNQQYICDFSKIRDELKQLGLTDRNPPIRCIADLGRYFTQTGQRDNKNASYVFGTEGLSGMLVENEAGWGDGKGNVRYDNKPMRIIRPSLEDIQLYTYDVGKREYALSTVYIGEEGRQKKKVLKLSEQKPVRTDEQIQKGDEMQKNRIDLLKANPTIVMCQELAGEMDATFSPLFVLMQNGGISTREVIDGVLAKRGAMKDWINTTGKTLQSPQFRSQLKSLEAVIKGRDPGYYRDEAEQNIAFLLSDIEPIKEFFGPGGGASNILGYLDNKANFKENDFAGRWQREGWKLVVIVMVTVAAMSLTGGLAGGVAGVLFSSAVGGVAGAVTQEMLEHVQEGLYTQTQRGRKYIGIDDKEKGTEGMTYKTYTAAELYAEKKITRGDMISAYGTGVAQQMGMSLGLNLFGRFVGAPLAGKMRLGEHMQRLKNGIGNIAQRGEDFLAKYITWGANKYFAKLMEGGRQIVRGGRNTVHVVQGSEVVQELGEELILENIAAEILGPAGELFLGVFGTVKGGDTGTTRVGEQVSEGSTPIELIDVQIRGQGGETDYTPVLLVSGNLDRRIAEMEADPYYAGMGARFVQLENGIGYEVSVGGGDDGEEEKMRFIELSDDIPEGLQKALFQLGIFNIGEVITETQREDEAPDSISIFDVKLTAEQQRMCLELLRRAYAVRPVAHNPNQHNVVGAHTGESYVLNMTAPAGNGNGGRYTEEARNTEESTEANSGGGLMEVLGTNIVLSHDVIQHTDSGLRILPLGSEEAGQLLSGIDKNRLPGLEALNEQGNYRIDGVGDCHNFAVTCQGGNTYIEAAIENKSRTALALVAQEIDMTNQKDLEPGQLVLFTRDEIQKESSLIGSHSAIYLGNGYYLSKFGENGPVAVTMEGQIQAFYGVHNKYRIPRTPKELVAEDLEVNSDAVLFHHHIDNIIRGMGVDVFPNPDDVSTGEVIEKLRELALSGARQTISEKYMEIVEYFQGMDDISRMVFAEMLLRKEVGEEILAAHERDGSLREKQQILEREAPGLYTSQDIAILFRRGICGKLATNRHSPENKHKNASLLSNRLEGSISLYEHVLFPMYKHVPYKNLLAFLNHYPEVTAEQLYNTSLKNFILTYEDFHVLDLEYGMPLSDLLQNITVMKVFKEGFISFSELSEAQKGILRNSFESTINLGHCYEAPESMLSSIRNKGGAIIKGPTTMVYTKYDEVNATSLVNTGKGWNEYGDVADLYYTMCEEVWRVFNAGMSINDLETYFKGLYNIDGYELIKDIKISPEGLLILNIAEDPNYQEWTVGMLKDQGETSWNDEDYEDMLDSANTLLPEFEASDNSTNTDQTIQLLGNGDMRLMKKSTGELYVAKRLRLPLHPEYVQYTQEVWGKLSGSGIPTFERYNIEADAGRVTMPYIPGAFSPANGAYGWQQFGKWDISEKKLDDIATQIKDIVRKAESAGLAIIDADSFFYIYDATTDTYKVMVGDLESVVLPRHGENNEKDIIQQVREELMGSDTGEFSEDDGILGVMQDVPDLTIDTLIADNGKLLYEIRELTPSNLHVIDYSPELVQMIKGCTDKERSSIIKVILQNQSIDKSTIQKIIDIHNRDIAEMLKIPATDTIEKINSLKFKSLVELGIPGDYPRILMEFGVCGKDLDPVNNEKEVAEYSEACKLTDIFVEKIQSNAMRKFILQQTLSDVNTIRGGNGNSFLVKKDLEELNSTMVGFLNKLYNTPHGRELIIYFVKMHQASWGIDSDSLKKVLYTSGIIQFLKPSQKLDIIKKMLSYNIIRQLKTQTAEYRNMVEEKNIPITRVKDRIIYEGNVGGEVLYGEPPAFLDTDASKPIPYLERIKQDINIGSSEYVAEPGVLALLGSMTQNKKFPLFNDIDCISIFTLEAESTEGGIEALADVLLKQAQEKAQHGYISSSIGLYNSNNGVLDMPLLGTPRDILIDRLKKYFIADPDTSVALHYTFRDEGRPIEIGLGIQFNIKKKGSNEVIKTYNISGYNSNTLYTSKPGNDWLNQLSVKRVTEKMPDVRDAYLKKLFNRKHAECDIVKGLKRLNTRYTVYVNGTNRDNMIGDFFENHLDVSEGSQFLADLDSLMNVAKYNTHKREELRNNPQALVFIDKLQTYAHAHGMAGDVDFLRSFSTFTPELFLSLGHELHTIMRRELNDRTRTYLEQADKKDNPDKKGETLLTLIEELFNSHK